VAKRCELRQSSRRLYGREQAWTSNILSCRRCANPHTTPPRLIFADYLDEAGTRGELIACRSSVALSPGDPARRELELRETELLDEYAQEWLAPLTELGAEGMSARCFQRGLIERVRISAEAFLEHGEELCRQAPALDCLERHARTFHALSRAAVTARSDGAIVQTSLRI
jgi:uncharacterized protein (TIGR02996 family)